MKTKAQTKPVEAPKKKTNMPGRWVVKPLRSIVLICICGNKYLKTRADQVTCVRCIVKAR